MEKNEIVNLIFHWVNILDKNYDLYKQYYNVIDTFKKSLKKNDFKQANLDFNYFLVNTFKVDLKKFLIEYEKFFN